MKQIVEKIQKDITTQSFPQQVKKEDWENEERNKGQQQQPQ